MSFFEWEDPWGYSFDPSDAPLPMEPLATTESLLSDDLLTGAGLNEPALVSMPPQNPADGGWSLQSIFDAIGSLGQTARDLGTVIGTAERDIKSATGEYQQARQNALQNNKLGQWWDYAPTTEKVMVVIGLAGLALVVYQIAKD